MQRLTARLVLVVSLTLAATSLEAANPGCALSGNHFDCPLLNGGNAYQAFFDINKPYLVENIRIHNDTSTWYQLQYVITHSTEANNGEISTYLNVFQTQQLVAGQGEVGSINKNPGNFWFPALTWESWNQGRGLSVPPGSTVFLHNNADQMIDAGVGQATLTYNVSFKPQVSGVMSFRQPRVDKPIACSGSNQWTAWNPWRNNDGRVWRTEGATIYSVDPSGSNRVDAACIYILNTGGQVRWSYCSNVNRRGRVQYPHQVIQPGESLAAQARHRCSVPGGLWDWAAFVHTWF